MAAIACELTPAVRGRLRAACGAPSPAPPRASRSPRPPATVYQRRRRVALAAALAVLLALVAVAAVTGAALSGHAAPARGAPGGRGGPGTAAAASGTVTLVVGPGETLWDLVRPHAPRGADAGGYVAAVAAANDLDPRALSPGTVVHLPAR